MWDIYASHVPWCDLHPCYLVALLHKALCAAVAANATIAKSAGNAVTAGSYMFA